MARRFTIKYFGGAIVASLLLVGCSQADASQSLAVLENDASATSVPKAVTGLPDIVEDSVRFIGDYQERSYFVARHASAPDSQVCLVEWDPVAEEAMGACSSNQNMTDDKIVALGKDSLAVALVADDPSVEYLEEAGWEKIADNLWAKETEAT